MSIFERWRKKKQPPQQPEASIEPERPKTIIDVGWDVIYAMEPDEARRRNLYNSLEREEESLLGRGSLFVSGPELDYFLKVMQELKARPVILFDFEKTDNPSENMLKTIEEYKNRPPAIVFVKNYFQDRADQLDPSADFDHWLRGKVQHDGWAAVIHGDRHAPGPSGNIAGSSKSTKASVEEDQARRK